MLLKIFFLYLILVKKYEMTKETERYVFYCIIIELSNPILRN